MSTPRNNYFNFQIDTMKKRQKKRLKKVCVANNICFDTMIGNKCQYCNIDTIEVDQMFIYGKKYNDSIMKYCTSCGAYVGCHEGTNIGYGVTANQELRSLKNEAHKYFDILWIKAMKQRGWKKHGARIAAYKWLSKSMNKPFELTHIGMFNDSECKVTIELCKPFFNSKYTSK